MTGPIRWRSLPLPKTTLPKIFTLLGTILFLPVQIFPINKISRSSLLVNYQTLRWWYTWIVLELSIAPHSRTVTAFMALNTESKQSITELQHSAPYQSPDLAPALNSWVPMAVSVDHLRAEWQSESDQGRRQGWWILQMSPDILSDVTLQSWRWWQPPSVPGDWVMSLMSSLSQLNCPGSRFNLAPAPAWPRDQEISVRAEEMWCDWSGWCRAWQSGKLG